MTKVLSESEKIIAGDNLIADVQFAIHNLLVSKNILRAELARRLGVSEARVSQMFEDEPRNLTLRTVAQIFYAVGEEARVICPALERIIPSPTVKHSAPSPTRVEATIIRLRAEERARGAFQRACNDNSDINGLNLVA